MKCSVCHCSEERTVQCPSSDVITVSTDDRGTPLPGAAPGRQKAGDVGPGIMSYTSHSRVMELSNPPCLTIILINGFSLVAEAVVS